MREIPFFDDRHFWAFVAQQEFIRCLVRNHCLDSATAMRLDAMLMDMDLMRYRLATAEEFIFHKPNTAHSVASRLRLLKEEADDIAERSDGVWYPAWTRQVANDAPSLPD
jgi:hypothetical protein